MKDYLRCVAALDDAVGRLLAYLDESGLARNTVVVYASDHGLFLGDHGLFDKRWPYEQSLRTPLIVRWPGRIKAGTEESRLVLTLDVAPTMADLAGARIPAEMQGKSLLPLLLGKAPADWRRALYFHYFDHPVYEAVPNYYGVRTGRYKLIHFHEQGRWELFDLAQDPGEIRNLHQQPAYAAVTAQLTEELKGLRRLYAVPESTPASAPARRR
jgi:arylsulfatase A-like enzyme